MRRAEVEAAKARDEARREKAFEERIAAVRADAAAEKALLQQQLDANSAAARMAAEEALARRQEQAMDGGELLL